MKTLVELVTGVGQVLPHAGIPCGRDIVDLYKGGDDLILPSHGGLGLNGFAIRIILVKFFIPRNVK